MKKVSRMIIATLVLLTLMAVGGKCAWAAPAANCPPLCILPPDPAPPMPPINFPDPPIRPMVAAPSSGGSGAKSSAAPVQAAPVVSVTGTVRPGAACTVGSHYGTVVQSGGQYSCNFTPSTLPAGAACHYNSSMGTVTVVDGKRYCKI